MSRYTGELRYILEQAVNDKVNMELLQQGQKPDYRCNPLDESVWPKAWEKLGLDDYPIYEEAHRKDLNALIIRRYYMREIGFEIPRLFAFYVRARMIEIMPYYNELYKMIEAANPLDEIDMRYTSDDTTDTTGNSTSHTSDAATADSTSVFSATPMSNISGGIDAIRAGRYATNATVDDSESTGTSDSNVDSTGKTVYDSDRTERGRRHSVMQLASSYRQEVMNIDQRITEELGDLFMLVY